MLEKSLGCQFILQGEPIQAMIGQAIKHGIVLDGSFIQERFFVQMKAPNASNAIEYV